MPTNPPSVQVSLNWLGGSGDALLPQQGSFLPCHCRPAEQGAGVHSLSGCASHFTQLASGNYQQPVSNLVQEIEILC